MAIWTIWDVFKNPPRPPAAPGFGPRRPTPPASARPAIAPAVINETTRLLRLENGQLQALLEQVAVQVGEIANRPEYAKSAPRIVDPNLPASFVTRERRAAAAEAARRPTFLDRTRKVSPAPSVIAPAHPNGYPYDTPPFEKRWKEEEQIEAKMRGQQVVTVPVMPIAEFIAARVSSKPGKGRQAGEPGYVSPLPPDGRLPGVTVEPREVTINFFDYDPFSSIAELMGQVYVEALDLSVDCGPANCEDIFLYARDFVTPHIRATVEDRWKDTLIASVQHDVKVQGNVKKIIGILKVRLEFIRSLKRFNLEFKLPSKKPEAGGSIRA